MKKSIPTLSLFDAVNIALGAIIGAGIFVVIGAAAGLAGPAVFISVLVAALVALLTGLASSELSRRYPKSGGAYLFARETISEPAGFLIGWVWLFSNIVAGATVAVGFGYYLAYFIPVPAGIGAALAIFAVTCINLLGAGKSSMINNALVAVKMLILLFFVVSAVFAFKPGNFQPLMPFGVEGILAGAATIFFAYAGFARVAVVADEIKDPKKNVPRATLISIGVSSAIYLAVAVAAVGIAGYKALSDSGAPLAAAMEAEGFGAGASVMALGALVATATVAISAVFGLSRLAQAMANDGQLPSLISKTDSGGVPKNAVLSTGAAMLIFAVSSDLPHIAYISSFSLLLYYCAINLIGIRTFKGNLRFAAAAGLFSCIVLMLSLPQLSWLVGIGVVILGAAYYFSFVRKRKGAA